MLTSNKRASSTLQPATQEIVGDWLGRAPYIPGLRYDPPCTRILDEEQHLDAPAHLPIVLGHLAGRQRDRNVAEDPDLCPQYGLMERTQLCSCQALRLLDKGLNALALSRARSGVECRLRKEVGRKGIPIGRCFGRPSQAPELPGNQPLDRPNIISVLVSLHGVSPHPTKLRVP